MNKRIGFTVLLTLLCVASCRENDTSISPATPFVGTYRYASFEQNGRQLVDGEFTLQQAGDSLVGTSRLRQLSPLTVIYTEGVFGDISGRVDESGRARLVMLNMRTIYVEVRGSLSGKRFTGERFVQFSFSSDTTLRRDGTFEAIQN
jgi:hypothetical protein